jgi:MraZ protein
MFAGTHKLTMDDKGRLAIPARLRTQLSETHGKQIVVTLGPESIEMYPVPEFRRIAEAIAKIPERPKRMQVERLFVGHAVEIELDAQGRVLVPTVLRERMQLGNEVVLVGLSNRLELWPEAQWNATTTEGLANYADAFAALVP